MCILLVTFVCASETDSLPCLFRSFLAESRIMLLRKSGITSCATRGAHLRYMQRLILVLRLRL